MRLPRKHFDIQMSDLVCIFVRRVTDLCLECTVHRSDLLCAEDVYVWVTCLVLSWFTKVWLNGIASLTLVQESTCLDFCAR